mmetsp:Transcript_11388/g.24170  ORF Transcript_11388/g.24170 Transcript_11388/m.24170 type:complete len:599 (+) Transcript_11388:154-1950(+)
MQNSCDPVAMANDLEPNHATSTNTAEITPKANPLGSAFDGSGTLVSNISADEDQCASEASSNTNVSTFLWRVSKRKWGIAFAVILGLCILGGGFWLGWYFGEKKTTSKSRMNEFKSMNISEDTSINPADGLSPAPSVSLRMAPTDNNSTIPISITSTTAPTKSPTVTSVDLPSDAPTVSSTTTPTIPPTMRPTTSPTASPTMPRTEADIEVTYIPGNLTRIQNNLLLSEGLQSRIIAQSGDPVIYDNGSISEGDFHTLPDAGATFPDSRPWNVGGWIYVSNSEAKNETEGGVGAITFDKSGSVIDYKMVLENTYMNCGGGRTPWNTWVSCEEVEFTGQIYQVDPTGERPPEVMTLGSAGGRWESFAYDIRDKNRPHFFSTEDHNKGCTRRFTPDVTHWGGDEWKMLHETGVIDYLLITPNEERTGGTFEWTDDIEAAKNNARSFYPQSEGIDIQDGIMYIVCKKVQQLFIFDLDQMNFSNVSTVSGLFDGGPDQMQHIIGEEGGLLYFTEEGGKDAGVHARDQFGKFFTIFESPFLMDETTGLSFSPSGEHLYIAYQENGLLFEVTREDGLPFNAKSLDVKYHNSISSRRLNSQWIGM